VYALHRLRRAFHAAVERFSTPRRRWIDVAGSTVPRVKVQLSNPGV
jgi:hypothetical protein